MPSFSVNFEFSEGDEVFYVKENEIRVGIIGAAEYIESVGKPRYTVRFSNSRNSEYNVTEESLYGSFDDVIHSSSWNSRLGKAKAR